MIVRLLGTAAGGGLPQWNCACPNCAAARRGEIPSRTQSSVALSVDGRQWCLVNASPDLRAQLANFPPPPGVLRGTPISQVLLTNADLDHVLGLFLLREGGALALHATAEVRHTLSQGLNLEAVLGLFSGLAWRVPAEAWTPLLPGLQYRAIFLGGEAPRYTPGLWPGAAGHSIAYVFQNEATGRQLVVAPDVATIHPALASAFAEADAILCDGTFWDDDELQRLQPGARTATAMGHLPVGSGSLPVLAPLSARYKIYLHINNTNPMLRPGSAEAWAVGEAGLTVGWDGLEFTL